MDTKRFSVHQMMTKVCYSCSTSLPEVHRFVIDVEEDSDDDGDDDGSDDPNAPLFESCFKVTEETVSSAINSGNLATDEMWRVVVVVYMVFYVSVFTRIPMSSVVI